MRALSTVDKQALINAIASREGTARDLAKWYDITTADLRQFLDDNREAVEMTRQALEIAEEETTHTSADVTPKDLDELWITQKIARLRRYEIICDYLFAQAIGGRLAGADWSTALREFRSYAIAAANELGQLLHRGAGENSEGDTASYDIVGVNIDTMR